MKKSIKSYGFTLVELAIVLVIIGLLTAGVVGGQSLIESAKVNSQVAQLRSYSQSTAAFKLEYDQLPGDFNRAFDYWGTGCTDSGGIYCNGNGDGQVIGNVISSAWQEPQIFFIHLAKAGLLDQNIYHQNGKYTVGLNFPMGKINNVSGVGATSKNRDLYFFLGPTNKDTANFTSAWNAHSASPSLTVKQASSLDKKLDDGIPNSGGVRAVILAADATNFDNDIATNCVNSGGAAYNYSETTLICRLLIKASIN